MKATLVITLLVAAAAVAIAAPESGDCILSTTIGPKESVKSCSACQWQCLTDNHCEGITFDGVSNTKAELALIADCGDGYYADPLRSAGMCVLYDANSDFIDFVFDTQEQSCDECAQQCNTDSRCTSFAHNGVSYNNGDTCTAPPVVPIVPVTVPSPVPVVPSPVPVVPSPVPVVPSPVPTPPSPIPVPRPASTGIVVRPGVCNYDIIRYEFDLIRSFVSPTFDSDDCCAACKNSTTPCNVASFCFDSEDNGGCGTGCVSDPANGIICQGNKFPRYTCQLGVATLGPDGFPVDQVAAADPEAKGWVTVTVTPTNTPGLF